MRSDLALAGLLVGALAGLYLSASNLDLGGSSGTPPHLLALPGTSLSTPPTLSRAYLYGGSGTGADAAFYTVIACVLLVPWAFLGLTLVGHLHGQWARKAASRCKAVGGERRHAATGGRRGNPWPVQ